MPKVATRTPRKASRTTTRRMIMPMIMQAMIIKAMIMVITITMIMITPIMTMTPVMSMTSIAGMTITTAIPMLMTTSKPPRPRRRAAVRADAIIEDVVIEAVAQTPVDRGEMPDNEAAALYRLMTWLSPSFPVGAFSYSSGIEWAVEAGDIKDAASLRDWLTSMLADGAGFCDGIFLAQTHRAASSSDANGLRDIAELAAAFVPSRERHLETSAQGRAFIDIIRSAWNCDGLDQLVSACDGTIVYPVAVGLVSAAHAIPLQPAMHAFLHALVSNWISAGARLVPLGQTDCQRVLAQLEPTVVSTGKRALEASLDDLGSATFRADLASMRHETQYTRLFRS
jgi:urease accessory protein